MSTTTTSPEQDPEYATNLKRATLASSIGSALKTGWDIISPYKREIALSAAAFGTTTRWRSKLGRSRVAGSRASGRSGPPGRVAARSRQ